MLITNIHQLCVMNYYEDCLLLKKHGENVN